MRATSHITGWWGLRSPLNYYAIWLHSKRQVHKTNSTTQHKPKPASSFSLNLCCKQCHLPPRALRAQRVQESNASQLAVNIRLCMCFPVRTQLVTDLQKPAASSAHRGDTWYVLCAEIALAHSVGDRPSKRTLPQSQISQVDIVIQVFRWHLHRRQYQVMRLPDVQEAKSCSWTHRAGMTLSRHFKMRSLSWRIFPKLMHNRKCFSRPWALMDSWICNSARKFHDRQCLCPACWRSSAVGSAVVFVVSTAGGHVCLDLFWLCIIVSMRIPSVICVYLLR